MHIFSAMWKIEERKTIFYKDLSREWLSNLTSELIIGMLSLNRHVDRKINRIQGFDGGMQSTCASPAHGLDRLTRGR